MLIIYLLISLLFVAFFSGIEIAFVSANKLLVELRKKREGYVSKILTHFYDKPAEFISTSLIGHNIALVIFTLLFTQIVSPWFSPIVSDAFGLSILITFITTIVVLVFGEYIPKAIFRMFADDIMFSFALPIRLFQFILAPPTWLMTKLSNMILRLFSKDQIQDEDSVFTRIDLEHFMNNKIMPQEEIDKTLFAKALKLKNIKVKQCMVPRNEIIHFDINDPIEELRILFQTSKLSRIIITKDDTDDIKGYVHHQQLLKNTTNIKSLLMPIEFVPEVMKVTEVMNKMIKDKSSIACVVDEYGNTSGIITLEDILEQIFGDIEDEHDHEDYIEQSISENEFIFSGRLDIEYINNKYPKLRIPTGEYHTLAGYITESQNNIPGQGTVIEQDGLLIVLELVSETKVETVRIKKMGNSNESNHS
jgi:putative hemolysin